MLASISMSDMVGTNSITASLFLLPTTPPFTSQKSPFPQSPWRIGPLFVRAKLRHTSPNIPVALFSSFLTKLAHRNRSHTGVQSSTSVAATLCTPLLFQVRVQMRKNDRRTLASSPWGLGRRGHEALISDLPVERDSSPGRLNVDVHTFVCCVTLSVLNVLC